jgi:hypothetical protein
VHAVLPHTLRREARCCIRGAAGMTRHRSADLRRHRNRALDIATVMRGGNRDPVRGHQRFGLNEREPAAGGLAIKK